MKIRVLLGVSAALFLTSAAFGDATIGSLVPGPNPTSGHTYLGQSFIAPTGETGLTSAKMTLHGSGSTDSNGFWRLFTFSDDGGTGTLGTQLGFGPISVLGSSGATEYSHVFNVPVVAGDKYALLVDWGSPNSAGGYFSNNSYYSGGTMILSTDGSTPVLYISYDMAFEVNFGQIPEPALLGVIAPLALLVRRRRPAL